MFSTVKLIALLALAASTASALQIQASSGLTSASTATIKWTNEVNDPTTWSFYLLNEAFHDNFGLANNVDPAAGSLTLTLPAVPARDGYTWEAVDLANVTHVYATSASFSIGALGSSTSSSASSTSSSASASASGSSSVSGSGSSTISRSTASTPAISTISRSTTTGASSTGTGASAAASASSSSGAFNGAASSLSTVSTAMMVLGAVAGAFVAL